jgi:hypothetical protein
MTYDLRKFYTDWLQEKKTRDRTEIILIAIVTSIVVTATVLILNYWDENLKLANVILITTLITFSTVPFSFVPIGYYLRRRFKNSHYDLDGLSFYPVEAKTLNEFDLLCEYRDHQNGMTKTVTLEFDIYELHLKSFFENPELFLIQEMREAVRMNRNREKFEVSAEKAKEIWSKK